MSDILAELLLIVILAGWLYIAYKHWLTRKESNSFYYAHVIAYRVGLIEKKAKENKIVLKFPPSYDAFVTGVESDVESDLSEVETVLD